MKKLPKTARVEIRVTAIEKQKLEHLAKKSGLSLSAYVLRCCTEKTPKGAAPPALWALLRELYALFDSLPAEKQEKLERLILRLEEAA